MPFKKSEKGPKVPSKYDILPLNFKKDNPREQEVCRFLQSAKNKRTQLVTFAVEEFKEKYNLDSASKKMLDLFLLEYSQNEVAVAYNTPKIDKTTPEETEQKKIEEDGLNDSFLDNSLLKQARSQMQLFGV